MKRKDQLPYRIEYVEDHAIIYFKYKNEFIPCLVDVDDIPKILSFPNTWNVIKENSGNYYVKSNLMKPNKKKTCIKLHRMLMQEPQKGFDVDHINTNSLDNRKENLRLLTRSENIQNRIKGYGVSEVIGVKWVKRDERWQAGIIIRGKQKYIGSYVDLEYATKIAKRVRAEELPHSYEAYESKLVNL